ALSLALSASIFKPSGLSADPFSPDIRFAQESCEPKVYETFKMKGTVLDVQYEALCHAKIKNDKGKTADYFVDYSLPKDFCEVMGKSNPYVGKSGTFTIQRVRDFFPDENYIGSCVRKLVVTGFVPD
ncbi:MAG: hypothetical protein LBF40_08760, partial [Deltaproteobacteria bacterium]|nr:hypothetical protein [Deltaproteobacteria bacterium]